MNSITSVFQKTYGITPREEDIILIYGCANQHVTRFNFIYDGHEYLILNGKLKQLY